MSPETTSRVTYAIDGVHSTIEFVVRHLMISKVRGRFTRYEGSIELAAGSDLPQAATVTIEAASIDTRDDQRDGHLRSPDFFDAEKHPTLAFNSTSVDGTPDSFRLHGALTMHGVTRDVTLEGSFEGRANDPWGNERVGYSAKTTVNRKEFGLIWNQAMDTGGVMLGEDITIELNIQAIKQV